MNEDKNKSEDKYLSYCIPAGLMGGTIIGILTPINIGFGVGIGMLLGVVIGTTIDYKVMNNKEENN